MEYLNDWMLIYRKFSELLMLFERYDDDVIVFTLLLLGFCYAKVFQGFVMGKIGLSCDNIRKRYMKNEFYLLLANMKVSFYSGKFTLGVCCAKRNNYEFLNEEN